MLGRLAAAHVTDGGSVNTLGGILEIEPDGRFTTYQSVTYWRKD
jgi:hypothetical protein